MGKHVASISTDYLSKEISMHFCSSRGSQCSQLSERFRMLNPVVQFIAIAFVLLFSSVGLAAQGPCPTCPGQTYEPDLNSAPYTTFIQDPATKCMLSVTWRNIRCDPENACTMMYLESISAVNICCVLDAIKPNLLELVDFVSRHALLTDPVYFGLGNGGTCARVYKKTCWIKPTAVFATGCDTEDCCYAERNGGVVTYSPMPSPNPVCTLQPGCTYVCKLQ